MKIIVLNVIIKTQGLEHKDGMKGAYVPWAMFD
jgi:hypothetical protein